MQYSKSTAPKRYICGNCGVGGVKLWRTLAFCASQVELRCVKCMDCGEVDSEGYFLGDFKTDQCTMKKLGSMLPAVPTEEEDTYWGYTSVPPDGVKWWRRLPNNRANALSYKCAEEIKSAIEEAVIADLSGIAKFDDKGFILIEEQNEWKKYSVKCPNDKQKLYIVKHSIGILTPTKLIKYFCEGLEVVKLFNFEYFEKEPILKYKLGVRNTLAHGEYTEFLDGQGQFTCYYKDGIKHGPFIKYYSNGKIKMKGNYRNGLLDGTFIEYSPGGNTLQARFRKGKAVS